MLYKFKSKVAADLIMLEPNGRRILLYLPLADLTLHAPFTALSSPRVEDCPGLVRVLEVERQLAARAAGEVPVLGVVVGTAICRGKVCLVSRR